MSHDEGAFERRERLKKLVLLGKERGYLTYAELNEHLPDDVSKSGQIAGIVGMINDMGIEVKQDTAKVYPFKKPD
jgi:RNA polymerase primary sigma factor